MTSNDGYSTRQNEIRYKAGHYPGSEFSRKMKDELKRVGAVHFSSDGRLEIE
jgi:hypothetical protein